MMMNITMTYHIYTHIILMQQTQPLTCPMVAAIVDTQAGAATPLPEPAGGRVEMPECLQEPGHLAELHLRGDLYAGGSGHDPAAVGQRLQLDR